MHLRNLMYKFITIYFLIIAGGLLTRAKRNAFQFGLMIWCETKRNPMAYNGYGCHCGVGGKGEPLDEIDR